MISHQSSYFQQNNQQTLVFTSLPATSSSLPETYQNQQRHTVIISTEQQQQFVNRNNINNRKCEVCSDKANGYNFNIVSCESCKAFFRRNAGLRDQYKCKGNNCCEINVSTRKKCRKCRIEKCFESGMIVELIMSKEEKEQRKMKRQVNNMRNFHEDLNEFLVSTTFKNMIKINGIIEFNFF